MHWFIDEPVEEFNEHMAKMYQASYLFCMDETGPMWHGKDGEGDYNKCPHTGYQPRKPEPVCIEFNDGGCAKSDVMTYIEYEKAAKHATTSRTPSPPRPTCSPAPLPRAGTTQVRRSWTRLARTTPP